MNPLNKVFSVLEIVVAWQDRGATSWDNVVVKMVAKTKDRPLQVKSSELEPE